MAGKSFSDDGALSTKGRPCLLLKDYLRDDLSSCSSSGFKSFPRRHCCTTVRFLQRKDQGYAKWNLLRRSSNSSRKRCSTWRTKSALKKASVAVLNAVKLVPFPSISSGSAPLHLSQRNKKATLLSRKLLSRSFWRKTVANKEEGIPSDGHGDIPRWRSFREFLEEGNKPSDQNIQMVNPSANVASGRVSTSTSGSSWEESELTCHNLSSSSGSSNSESSSTENDLVEETCKTVEKEGSKTVDVAVGEDSMEGTVKVTTTSTCPLNNPRDWPTEEKEQFSPVSILNCPFEDDEEISSPNFNTRYSHHQGIKNKQMQKTRCFVSMTSQQVVVDLEKRIALLEGENEPYNSPTVIKPCSLLPMTMMSIQSDDYIEGKARDLVNLLQRSTPPNCLMVNAENLLFDFFKQSFEEHINIGNNNKCQVLKIAEDWINGKSQQLFLPWEIQEGRQLYVREMDKCGTWKSGQEKQDLALDLEFELFTCLVNDLLIDLTSC